MHDGHEVAIACRRAGTRANLEDIEVTALVGDDRCPGQLADWVRGRDLVVDAAAPYPLQLFDGEKSGRDRLQSAIERSRRLIDAVHGQDAELVYVSSFTTLPRQLPWAARLQSAVIQGSHPYFETKAAIERHIVKAAAQGLRAVVINPSVCIGPWDLKARDACFVAAVARGDLWAVTRQAMNVIDVRDVADAALKSLAEKHYGQPIALSGHNVDLDSLVRKISRLAGRQAPLMRASTRITAAGAYWTDVMFGALGQSAPFPSLPFLLLCECRAMSMSAAQQKLGLATRPLEATLRDALSWYRSIDYC